MDSEEDASEYEAIDNQAVNREFAASALAVCPMARCAIDLGTGPGLIPIIAVGMAPTLSVTAIDLAEHMLERARINVRRAGLEHRVAIERRNVKATELPSASFDLVMCNSVLHHLPDPVELLREVKRLVAPGGGLYIKDLLRPGSDAELSDLLSQRASKDTPYQRQLFADSLRAALTVDEAESACQLAGLEDVVVKRTSDRHYCISRQATFAE